MMFKIRFNNRTYLVEVLDTNREEVLVRFSTGEEEWIALVDWNRYCKNHADYEEEQNSYGTSEK